MTIHRITAENVELLVQRIRAIGKVFASHLRPSDGSSEGPLSSLIGISHFCVQRGAPPDASGLNGATSKLSRASRFRIL